MGNRSRPLSCEVTPDSGYIQYFGKSNVDLELDDVLTEVKIITGSNLLSSNSFIDGSALYLYSISDKINKEPKKGDIVEGGLKLFVDKQKNKFNATIYTNRLVCSNGMVHTEDRLKWSKKASTVPDDFFNDIKMGFDNYCNAALEYINTITGIEVKDLTMIDKLFNEYAKAIPIPQQAKDRLRNAILDSSITSMWDIWVAMTEEVTHGDFQEDKQRDLLYRFCGRTVETAAKGQFHCKSCGNNLLN